MLDSSLRRKLSDLMVALTEMSYEVARYLRHKRESG